MPSEFLKSDGDRKRALLEVPGDRHGACLERMAQCLEETGDFRVLRRMRPITDCGLDEPPTAARRMLIVLDVETTGLDVEKDSIIELAMIKAEYTLDGTICRVIDTFAELQEPTEPLPAEITRLTGISDAMVEGRKIDPEAVCAFLGGSSALVVAHHAAFDRACVESKWPIFEHMPWACTTQIDWKALGFENAKLSTLLAGIGFFYSAHRAQDDCQATLHLLAHRPNGSSQTALGILLDAARRNSKRIWALHAPFSMKDRLKERKFRWNPGYDGRPKAWFVDIDESLADAEADFLRQEIYGYDAELMIEEITAFNRFSRRRGRDD